MAAPVCARGDVVRRLSAVLCVVTALSGYWSRSCTFMARMCVHNLISAHVHTGFWEKRMTP